MYALLGLGILVLALFLYLGMRRAPRQTKTRQASPAKRVSTRQQQLRRLREDVRYWGAAIESHCRASSRYAGAKFQFDELPALPVKTCEAGECRCCLIGLPDQRKQSDRRSGTDRRGALRLDSDDRRSRQPRRRSDSNSWGAYGHL